MPKNAYIIDHDEDFAKKIAAILKADSLQVSIADSSRDPVPAIRLERPDVLLVRADGVEEKSGFSLCNQVKKNKRLSGTRVVIYSTDGDSARLEAHRNQEAPADAYLALSTQPPYHFDDLRIVVREVLFPPGGSETPPPLPAPKDEVRPVTKEDDAFIEQVLDSLSGSTTAEDIDSEPPRPRSSSLSGRRTTADAKLDMLRQKLRQREQELAKVMEMYRAKEREYHEWDERLIEKDVEAQSLRMTIEELAGAGEAVQNELERRTYEFNESFQALVDEQQERELALRNVLTARDQELEQTRADAQTVEATLRERIDDLERSSAAMTEAKAAIDVAAADLDRQLAERTATLASTTARLGETEQARQVLSDTCAQQVESMRREGDARVAFEAVVVALRTELTETREEIDKRAREHRFEVEAKDELFRVVRADFSEAEASFTQLEADLRRDVDRLTADLEERTAERDANAQRRDELDRALREATEQAASMEENLRAEIASLTTELHDERRDHEATRSSLGAELDEAGRRYDMLSAERDRQVQEAAEQHADLTARLSDRDARIESLEIELADVRSQAESTEASLRADVAQLEHDLAEQTQAGVDARASFEAQIADLDETVRGLTNERDDVTSALEEARGEIAVLRTQIQTLEENLIAEGLRFDELSQQAAEEKAALEDKLAETEIELDVARSEATAMEQGLRTKVSGLETEAAEHIRRIEDLARTLQLEQRDRATAETSNAELKTDLTLTRGQLESTATTLRETERELNGVRETLALREGRIAEIQDVLADERRENEKKDEALAGLRTDLGARGAEVGRLEGKVGILEENVATMRTEQADLEERLDFAQSELAARQADLATARTEASERSTRLDELMRTHTAQSQDLAAVRKQVAELLDEHEQLTVDRDTARAEASERATRLEETSTMLGNRERELEKLRAQNTQLVGERDHLTAARDALEQERKRLASELEILSMKREELSSDLDSTETARIELTASLARTEEALSRLQGEFERSRTEWTSAREELVQERDKVRGRLTELGQELDRTRDEREEARNAKLRLEEQSTARIEQDRVQIEALQGANRELNESARVRSDELGRALDDLRTELRTTIEELEIARRALEVEQQKGEALTREKASLATEIARLGEAQKAFEEQAAGEKGELEFSIVELQEKLEAETTARASEAAAADQKRRDLEGRLDRVSHELAVEREHKTSDTKRTTDEIASLSQRLQEVTDRASQLSVSMKEAAAQHEADAKALALELAGAKEKLAARKAELGRAQRELEELSQEIDNQRRERDDVEAKFDEAQEDYVRQLREKDEQHAKEVEELRRAALDAKRREKASQMTAARLTDRVQKLETQKPSKTAAQVDFESFMSQFGESRSSRAGRSTGQSSSVPPTSASPSTSGAAPGSGSGVGAGTGTGSAPGSGSGSKTGADLSLAVGSASASAPGEAGDAPKLSRSSPPPIPRGRGGAAQRKRENAGAAPKAKPATGETTLEEELPIPLPVGAEDDDVTLVATLGDPAADLLTLDAERGGGARVTEGLNADERDTDGARHLSSEERSALSAAERKESSPGGRSGDRESEDFLAAFDRAIRKD